MHLPLHILMREVIRGNQRQSEAVMHLPLDILMREVIRGNQKPSEAAMHLPLNILIRSHALLLRPTRLALP